MPQSFNASIFREAINKFNLRDGNFFSNELPKIIVPVIHVEEPITFIKSGQATNTTNVTVYTTPTDKDFYLCSAHLTVAKDAVNDGTYSSIGITVNGQAIWILSAEYLGTTATQNISAHADFSRPIKIDRGTNVLLLNHTATAYIKATALIQGFLSETLSN